jgi:hypothetical protein
MLILKERRSVFRTIGGWARLVLLGAGAIRECEEHGWMRDRWNGDAVRRYLATSRSDPKIQSRCKDKKRLQGMPIRGSRSRTEEI